MRNLQIIHKSGQNDKPYDHYYFDSQSEKMNALTLLLAEGKNIIPRGSGLSIYTPADNKITRLTTAYFDGWYVDAFVFSKEETFAQVANFVKSPESENLPCIIKDGRALIVVNQSMNVEAIDAKKEAILAQIAHQDFLEQSDNSLHKALIVAQFPKLDIADMSLATQIINQIRAQSKLGGFWDELMHYIDSKREMRDRELHIKQLFNYACFLQKTINEKGTLTHKDVDEAADFSDLAFNMQKIHSIKYAPDANKAAAVRMDAYRLWADVVLAKFWAHSDKLLKAEGFSEREIVELQNKNVHDFVKPTELITDMSRLPITYDFYKSIAQCEDKFNNNYPARIARTICTASKCLMDYANYDDGLEDRLAKRVPKQIAHNSNMPQYLKKLETHQR